MALFNDMQISEMAGWFGDLAFDGTCTIQRGVRTPTSSQGSSETWPPLYNDVPCLIASESNPRQNQTAQQTTARNEKLLCLPLGQDIKRNDRVLRDGISYQVIDLPSPVSNDVFTRAVIQRREVGAGS